MLRPWPTFNRKAAFLGATLPLAVMAQAKAADLGPPLPSPLTVRLGHDVTFTPFFVSDVDQGSFSESAPGGQSAGPNLRRMQLGGHLALPAGFELGFVYDFGHSPGERARVLEAQAIYSLAGPLKLSAGILKPQFSQESVQNGNDTPFLERASIVDITRNIAASSGRVAVQVSGSGERWLAGVALTAGLTGQVGGSGQRAVVGRGSVLLVKTGAVILQAGASGQYVYRPANPTGGEPSLALSNTLELAIDTVEPSVSTGPGGVRNAAVAGPEASFAWRNLLLQGEWYGIELDRSASERAARFSGWYAQAMYMVAGPTRSWDPGTGVWLPPQLPNGFDPRQGLWGAVELGVRYSEVNLDGSGINGGRQGVWSAVASWWPVHQVRLMGELLHADVTGGPSSRRADAAAGRFQLLF